MTERSSSTDAVSNPAAHTGGMDTTARLILAAVIAVALSLVGAASPADASPKRDRRPVVTVVDQTQGAWPVKAVARAWSHPHLVRVIVRDACQSDTYCVTVVAGDFGAEWMGAVIPAGLSAAMVYLNDSPEMGGVTTDPVVRSGIVCHELAHTLGIDHQPPSVGQWGCIANSDHAHTTAVPSFRDKRLLREAARDPFGTQWGAFYWHAVAMKVAASREITAEGEKIDA